MKYLLIVLLFTTALAFPSIDGNRRGRGCAFFNASFNTEFEGTKNGLPNPRLVSNLLGQQVKKGNSHGLSALFVYMGQFIDHDITLTASSDMTMDIPLSDDDELFSINNGSFPFRRSSLFNLNTAFLDLSSVYGDTLERSQLLREMDGSGKLKENKGMLPKNKNINMDMAEADDKSYACGDPRCNENTILLGFHTLFLREHNRLAQKIKKKYPFLHGEKVFQRARLRNIQQYQKILFEEWLPILLGTKKLNWRRKQVLKPDTFFATVAFRFGHTQIPDKLKFQGKEEDLFDHFFKPEKATESTIDYYMQGITEVEQEETDLQMVDALRNKLFINENQSLDLLSLNIQRGRDHKLLALPEYYKKYTGTKLTKFEQLTNDPVILKKLNALYGRVDRVDPFIGCLAEKPKKGLLGPLMREVVKYNFELMASNDRYFYKRPRWRHRRFKNLKWLMKKHFKVEKQNNIFKL